MKIIECIAGSTEQNVGGSTYRFKLDDYGRYTVKIFHQAHQKMFLSRPSIYREVPEHPLQVSEKSARSIRPKADDKKEPVVQAETTNEPVVLTPQQRAAQTRAANKAAKEKEAAEAAQKEQV